MTPAEAARVLARAAAFDKRTASEVEARAWAEALPEINEADAIEAIVRHYRASTEYLMPGHVRVGARSIIGERQDRAAMQRGLPGPPPATAEARAQILAEAKARLRARFTDQEAT
jgi:hypothetical protein